MMTFHFPILLILIYVWFWFTAGALCKPYTVLILRVIILQLQKLLYIRDPVSEIIEFAYIFVESTNIIQMAEETPRHFNRVMDK